ncbi:MAG: FAD-dependent oxidoreductase [Zoogloeaceae bacterium]|jgi:2-octaprenyl-6-methoxyphenol hydroxylase|nr:FAD-dependent oxidoreductase [Zoogloeaceae bacterium]
MPKVEASIPVDIAVIGGGPVGMTLALAMKESAHSVLVVDKRPFAAQAADPRALALSHGTRLLLASLGVWPEKRATAIHDIHVSQRGGFGRARMTAAEHGLPALGYVLRYRDLAAALQSAASRLPRLAVRQETEVAALRPLPDGEGIDVTLLESGAPRQYRARLVVHAEGAPADDAADVRVADYRQHAVICDVRPDRPHEQRAWERFTPDGPLALLPLEEGFSIVFTVPPEKADFLMSLAEADFLRELSRQFGSRFGFVAASRRDRFPLFLRERQRLVEGVEVWIGNAAQTLHPVSGQGFNLGLRDAWLLAEELNACANLGDPARLRHALSTYAARRVLDRKGGAFFTDTAVRLFSNDWSPLRWLRGMGLLGLDLLPPARNFIARRMIWGARAW